MRGLVRRAAILPIPVSVWLVLPDVARAQGTQVGDQPLVTPFGLVHGVAQGSGVFLAGLVAFVALVWLPVGRDAGVLFGRGAWVLFGLLAFSGLAELSLFTMRASGEPLSFPLFAEALFDTRTGGIWLARLGLGLLTVLLAGLASRRRLPALWWAAAGSGGALLLTLAQQGHAAAEGGMPLLAGWLHVVGAALWMGGLLGFPMLLLGPLRVLEPDERLELRAQTVRRFSRVATFAVVAIILTGFYAALLQVPGPLALVSTPYGRALIMKLGLMVLLLTIGGINLVDKGRGPFGRMVGAELVLAAGIFIATGFLTSLPPAGSVVDLGAP